jgi:hypothetical protein
MVPSSVPGAGPCLDVTIADGQINSSICSGGFAQKATAAALAKYPGDRQPCAEAERRLICRPHVQDQLAAPRLRQQELQSHRRHSVRAPVVLAGGALDPFRPGRGQTAGPQRSVAPPRGPRRPLSSGVIHSVGPPSVYKEEPSENAQFSCQSARCPTYRELWSTGALTG